MIKKYKNKTVWLQTTLFALLALLFFLASFYTQGDIDKMASAGIGFDERLNFDGERWLAPTLLSDRASSDYSGLKIENGNGILRKDFPLKKIPEKATIIWHGFWEDLDKNYVDENCSIILGVNDASYDVSNVFFSQIEWDFHWMSVSIDGSALQHDNILTLKSDCSDIEIFLSTQDVYTQLRTSTMYNGRFQLERFSELMLFIKQDNSKFYEFLFKLGFIFRILGIICLFLAIYGLGFTKHMFHTSWKEFIASTIVAYFIYWFAVWIETLWGYLAKTVTYAIYVLFKILFLNPVVSFADPEMPFISIKNFGVYIVSSCSGVDSIGYFLLVYSLLLIFFWRKIKLMNALLFFVIGIVGVFLVNILRVFLIMLVGAFISREFALNAFHTNIGMVLFILYFFAFWMIAKKYLLKETSKSSKLSKKKKTAK